MYMANTYESYSHGACMRSHLLTKVGNLSLALSVTIYNRSAVTRRATTVFSSSPILVLGLCTAAFVIVYLRAIPPNQHISLDYLSWAPLSTIMANCTQVRSWYRDFVASSDRLIAIVKHQGLRIIARIIAFGRPIGQGWGSGLMGAIRYGRRI